MKKTISILLAMVMLTFATSALAATGTGPVENRTANTVFASTFDGDLPAFEPDDVVNFDITGVKEGDWIALLTLKYGSEPSNTSVQYIDQYTSEGDTQNVSYVVRDLDAGTYELKIKANGNELYRGFYAVTPKGSTPQTVDVTGVTLDESDVALNAGETKVLTATVAPADATNKEVSWTSSDETVATVSNGTVTAVAEGTAVITVTTTDGNKTATCTITVQGAVSVLYGDVNSDEKVNAKDVTVLARYVAKWNGVEIDANAADVNSDEKVNAKDVTVLARYVAKWNGYETLPKAN